MGCCGHKRDSLKTNPFPTTSATNTPSSGNPQAPPSSFRPAGGVPSPAPTDPAPPQSAHTIALRYTETSRVIVVGPSSRRRYEFSAAQPVQRVDSRDVSALVGSRFFKIH
jgi:hypothetical protein